MAKKRNGAPDVSVDEARGVVTISGKVAWEALSGDLDLARPRTDYRIELPLEGSPFDSEFVRPPKGAAERLARDGALRFGEPLASRGSEADDDLPARLLRLTERAAPPGFGTELVVIKGPGGDLSIKGIEGSFKSAAVVEFNAKMTAVTEVTILFRARLEDADGDLHKGALEGVDAWKGGLKIAGAAKGSAAGGGDAGVGGDVGGVPGVLARDIASGASDDMRGAQDDRLRGQDGDDALRGRGGDNDVRGGPGVDRLRGGRGDDELHGGRGADRLHDGAGEDRLTGGRGADVFVMSHDGERDVITDFDPGRDLINLTAFGPGLDFEDLALSAREGAVILRLAGETLELGGDLSPADLSADDFLFA